MWANLITYSVFVHLYILFASFKFSGKVDIMMPKINFYKVKVDFFYIKKDVLLTDKKKKSDIR